MRITLSEGKLPSGVGHRPVQQASSVHKMTLHVAPLDLYRDVQSFTAPDRVSHSEIVSHIGVILWHHVVIPIHMSLAFQGRMLPETEHSRDVSRAPVLTEDGPLWSILPLAPECQKTRRFSFRVRERRVREAQRN